LEPAVLNPPLGGVKGVHVVVPAFTSAVEPSQTFRVWGWVVFVRIVTLVIVKLLSPVGLLKSFR
jgi:hypothetical protein